MNFFKILVNIVLYVIYALIGVIVGNFLYGLVLTMMGTSVPSAQDEVHMKVAIFILVLVLIITFLFRKFLYFSIGNKQDEEDDIKVAYNKEEIKEKKVVRETFKNTKKEEVKSKKKDDEDIEIYVTKEIK